MRIAMRHLSLSLDLSSDSLLRVPVIVRRLSHNKDHRETRDQTAKGEGRIALMRQRERGCRMQAGGRLVSGPRNAPQANHQTMLTHHITSHYTHSLDSPSLHSHLSHSPLLSSSHAPVASRLRRHCDAASCEECILRLTFQSMRD